MSSASSQRLARHATLAVPVLRGRQVTAVLLCMRAVSAGAWEADDVTVLSVTAARIADPLGRLVPTEPRVEAQQQRPRSRQAVKTGSAVDAFVASLPNASTADDVYALTLDAVFSTLRPELAAAFVVGGGGLDPHAVRRANGSRNDAPATAVMQLALQQGRCTYTTDGRRSVMAAPLMRNGDAVAVVYCHSTSTTYMGIDCDALGELAGHASRALDELEPNTAPR